MVVNKILFIFLFWISWAMSQQNRSHLELKLIIYNKSHWMTSFKAKIKIIFVYITFSPIKVFRVTFEQGWYSSTFIILTECYCSFLVQDMRQKKKKKKKFYNFRLSKFYLTFHNCHSITSSTLPPLKVIRWYAILNLNYAPCISKPYPRDLPKSDFY